MSDMEELAAFVRERLDDDERELQKDPPVGLGYANLAARMSLEIVAKRRILAEVKDQIDEMDSRIEGEWGITGSHPTGESDLLLKLLALPYSADARYRAEWAPAQPEGETDGT